MIFLLAATVVDAVITAMTPLLFGVLIDDGIISHNLALVIGLAATVAAAALLDALANYVLALLSARIGQGLIYDLRTEIFARIQEQPLAFFARAQTGSLVSRLNTDVIGAEQTLTILLSQSVSAVLTLALVVSALFYLSWQLTIVALALIPFFIFPGKVIGRKLQRLTRENMQLDAEMGSLMNERFNVAGAMLTKIYGRPEREIAMFSNCAGRIRKIGVRADVTGQLLGIIVTTVSMLVLALVFGIGGVLVIDNVLKVGTLVALITLIGRLKGPVTEIPSIQVLILRALVSFDRVFEVMDLKPQVVERTGAFALPAPTPGHAAPEIEFDDVSFRYPMASEVSLPTLESIVLPAPERGNTKWILNHITFRAPAGKLTALVGPSGAGKTTITHLVPRFYDPGLGTVRFDEIDIRDLTLQSLRDTVGVVSQDAHLFHDTIRNNLLYARPGATERELIEACKATQIWPLIASLPDGLDTVVGDHGYRLSGGEKQRVSLARLLLKGPPIVVLDEATAHVDSESEAAIQRALRTALEGRTSLVIAHRLSTICNADQILVVNGGQITERGTHEELLAAGMLYTTLYHTQFAVQVSTSAR